MIDLTVHQEALERNIQKAKEQQIIIPTIAQMKDPDKIPEAVRERQKKVGLWDVNPLNLFRISWKNEQKERGGLYGNSNYIVLPSELTGVKAKIICMIGKWFPTGCHKVGASFGCLAPRLITGQFDVSYHKAVWPSTGNYCRGGAFNSKLLGAQSIAILPAEMSRERFEWLSKIAGEVIATPGCESNVKEIFDKTWELRTTREDVLIFNQFEEMGNYLWHYNVTGSAIADAFEEMKEEDDLLTIYDEGMLRNHLGSTVIAFVRESDEYHADYDLLTFTVDEDEEDVVVIPNSENIILSGSSKVTKNFGDDNNSKPVIAYYDAYVDYYNLCK